MSQNQNKPYKRKINLNFQNNQIQKVLMYLSNSNIVRFSL